MQCTPCFRLVALLVLLVAAPAGAQSLPASAATKQAKAVAKTLLKEVKVEAAAALTEFETAVGAFASAVAGDAAARVAAVQALATAWNTAHDDLSSTIAGAQQGAVLQLLPILTEFQAGAGAPFGGPYPKGFHPGDGGALDLVENGCRKELAKAEARMTTRLTKLVGKLEKDHGLAFTVRTRPLSFQMRTNLNAGGGNSSAAVLRTPGPELELLASVSPLDGAGDAVVGLAGAAPGNASVDVQLAASGLSNVDLNVTAASNGRWVALADLVAEGNYLVTVTADAVEVVALASLGVR